MLSSCNKLNVKYIFLAIILSCLWSLDLTAETVIPATAFQQVDSLLQHKDFATSQAILDELINQGKKSGDGWLLGKSYATLASLFLIKGEVDRALENYLLGLEFLDEENYPAEVGKIYANMGALYSKLKQFQEAESYLLKALQLHPSGSNRLKYLNNLFGVYLESGKSKLALGTFEEAITLARSQNNVAVEAILYTNLSNYYIGEGQWNQVISNARKSLQLRASLQQTPSVITLNNLGYALSKLKQYSESIRLYEQALPYANLAEKKQLFYNLYQANKSLGNGKESWRYIEAYDQVKDSLLSLNYAQKVAELDATYQAAEKQRKIEQLATTNMLQKKQLKQQTYLILAGVLIVVLALATWSLRQKQFKIKEKLEKSQLKYRFLLLQLNPHFIFNALQSVQHYIYRNDRDQSMEYLQRFSRLIRLVLENSEKDFIPLDEEIELLDNYLRLQQLNAEIPFSYAIIVNDNLDKEVITVPAMLLQPLVENAVMHGVKGHADGKIELVFNEEGGVLHILIKDNGNGFQLTKQEDTLHKSMSMDILQNRIKELNRIGKRKVSFEVLEGAANENNIGTAIHLSVAS